ncbi:MAG: hypothetical protein P1V51_16495 [Deltaproteobacteria bacterium]|nr:hypothetical protein [Deltaproteobacteria bacterium]
MLKKAAVLSGVLWVVGCGSPTINVVDPLAVVNWSPHDGATCIDPDWPGLTLSVCLSQALDPASAGSNVSLQTVDAAGAPAGAVSATVALASGDAACAQLTGFTLDPDTEYAIVLASALAAEDGTELGHQLISRFRTRDASCP